jgi:hypothetical protein
VVEDGHGADQGGREGETRVEELFRRRDGGQTRRQLRPRHCSHANEPESSPRRSKVLALPRDWQRLQT